MINYLANPSNFLRFQRIATPVIGLVIFLTSLALGLWLSLYASPADETQGEVVRIMYVHVPAAWGSMMAYTALTIASITSFVWRHRLADSAARAFAKVGIVFAFLALATGSIWGKPTWGTWWQWDGRTTSMLVFFFIYAAYLLIWSMVKPWNRAARLAAILAMVGSVNIPIIKFSVEWWSSLHQPATLSYIGAPGMPSELLRPLLMMAWAYASLFAWASLMFIKADVMALRARRQSSRPISSVTIKKL